jgi:hypothetical protein
MRVLTLGKIVRSNSHTDYVCQAYNSHEVEFPPSASDYAFGTFVKIVLTSGYLVGIIYDTVLLNPDFGRLGPRLSPENELEIFSPDYLNERAILIGIDIIGQVALDGTVDQGVPLLAAIGDALVIQMDEYEICQFHLVNDNLRLFYIPLLMQQGNPIVLHLARMVLRHLEELMPNCHGTLSVIADDLTWQTQIIPVRRS